MKKTFAVWILGAAVLPIDAAAQSPPPPFARTEQRAPCRDHDPLRRPLFGETHAHTGYSFDAYSIGTVALPRDAYRYAQGGAVYVADAASNPTRCAQQPRPLDFAVLTDHAEYFGAMTICTTPGRDGYDTPDCKVYRATRAVALANPWGIGLILDPPQPPRICDPDNANCHASSLSFWQDIQAAAEEAYDRSPACRFTSFVGYEWTSMPGNNNRHRNVVFRNDRVPKLPASNFDTGNDERVLWTRLQKECRDAGNGCDVLTIPHNGNLSGGQLYTLTSEENTAAYARLRSFWEPLSEIHQGKGNSECRTGTDTKDPECGFEQLIAQNLNFAFTGGGGSGKGDFAPNSFLRNVLKIGLSKEVELGANPFKLGFVGGTDTHNATPGGTDEANFVGLHGTTTGDAAGMINQVLFNPGGLAVVWAEENSRDAIFEAMRRRETYATSGTRPIVRFFAGWDLPRDLCSRTDFVQVGYQLGRADGRGPGAAAPPRLRFQPALRGDGDEGPGQRRDRPMPSPTSARSITRRRSCSASRSSRGGSTTGAGSRRRWSASPGVRVRWAASIRKAAPPSVPVTTRSAPCGRTRSSMRTSMPSTTPACWRTRPAAGAPTSASSSASIPSARTSARSSSWRGTPTWCRRRRASIRHPRRRMRSASAAR